MQNLEIPISLPEGIEGKHCAQHLVEFLLTHPGVMAATIDQQSSLLRMKFDANQLSLSEVQTIARELGADIGKQYHRCQRYLGKPRCRDCTELLEYELQNMPGVSHVSANPAASSILVEYESGVATPAEIEQSIHRLGYQVGVEAENFWTRWQRVIEVTLTGLCAIFIAAAALVRPGPYPMMHMVFHILAYLTGGYSGTVEALRALRHKTFDVNFLMIAAAIGAATIDQWQEGATLLFLFSLSNTLQAFAMDKTRHAIRKLMDLKPQEARLKIGNIEKLVAVEALQPGDVIIVKPGERIAADGIVITGSSSVDQAAITGESMPVEKHPGSEVFAGTVNGGGALEIRVSHSASDTTLAKIIKLVEEAQSEKAPTQRLIDRIGAWYTPAVIIATILMATIPTLVFHEPFNEFFYRAMVLLVVASPCALVISTPATILSAIANGARHGILYKGGLHLENTAHIKVVAFDKTGTLTSGKPVLTDIETQSGINENDLLVLAASIEKLSQHPIAMAITNEATRRQLPLLDATDLQIIPGGGVKARINGEVYFVGNLRLYEETGVEIPLVIKERIDGLEHAGKTTVLVGNRRFMGLIAVADVPRELAYHIVHDLKKVGVEKVAMLTGDRCAVANTVAQQLHLDEVHAELLPEEKVQVVKKLLQQHGRLAMVGDGVNDAPALASATVGFAMGAAGADVALETADVVLMSDDLSKLPQAISLSRRARRIIQQNLIFAMGVIAILVCIAVLGLLKLPIGVIGHEGSTVIVIANGLRLLSDRLS
ncbi:MAG: cation-translocating P-type ATPase [candidate division KSB1 bacterium]|nr:cation-translocating P-type ATPase [candidate division KSB1 bacterium]MDZ7302753.1 cation-translocating P-type ATPase [candidate division KSB1 bacterium]MDZ7310079.1 cation-translocating P-type ATPase [candidate division KSB1 bacterium]